MASIFLKILVLFSNFVLCFQGQNILKNVFCTKITLTKCAVGVSRGYFLVNLKLNAEIVCTYLKTNHFQRDPKVKIMDTLTSPITLLPIRLINIHVSGKTKVGNFANHSLGKHRCVVSFSAHFKKTVSTNN